MRRARSAPLARLVACLVAAACAGGVPGAGAAQQSPGDASAANALSSEEGATGWRLLFDGRTTEGWRGYRRADVPAGWQVVDGELTRVAGAGDIVTVERFADFELALEWKVEPGGNSGIMFRVTEDLPRTYESGPEMQVLDDALHRDGRSALTSAGANYALHPAPRGVVRAAGEWNRARIVVLGQHVEHWLNGVKVVEYELGSEDWARRVADSKFAAMPRYGREPRGHIALQDHGDRVAYRNIRIRVPGARATDTIPGTGVTFDMAWVPGGELLIGSPDDEPGRQPDEGPRRRVVVEPFWIGVHEVTHDAYALFRAPPAEDPAADGETPAGADALSRPSPPYEDPAHGMGKEGHPAVGMTREAALRFARWLSLATGRLYRLPTEAEWEWACRAGAQEPWSFGADAAAAAEHAWYEDNSQGAYHPVGSRAPNAWGLHDMHGNVAEWTSDPYIAGFYASLSAEAPPRSPRSGRAGRGRGVVRGGAFDDPVSALRCADRQPESAVWKRRDPQEPKSLWWNTDAPHVGFRLVREPGIATPEEIRAYLGTINGRD